jgi:molybdopterin-binding protein
MPRKDQGWITFQTSEEERQILETICQMSQRTKTEVLREMLRGLKSSTTTHSEQSESMRRDQNEAPKSSSPPKTAFQERTPTPTQPEVLHSRKPLKVSSRNVLQGKVKRLIKGSIHTEVTIEIVHRVELTSTITTTSAEALELAEGKTAYAVIKSSDVVIAMD